MNINQHKSRKSNMDIYSLCLYLCCVYLSAAQRYEPTWESLESRPLPSWFDEAKLGIFMHWGVFSVPSYSAVWFWNYWKNGHKDINNFMKRNYRPGYTYADFAADFKTEFYDPKRWAAILQASGAKYVVLVSKHHEGFTNWPSNYSWNWNSYDTGPHRDLVGELATAVRETTDLRFGLYHSLYEWFNPLYLKDKENNFTTQNFVKMKTMPELYELVNRYKPEVIWSDGDWEASDSYWMSKEFIAWLYNDSPVRDTVVTNDRWGRGDMCHHGGYLTCSDRYNPKTLQKRKFENPMTIDKNHWGFRREANIEDFYTSKELISTFAETISCGGNMLMNVGPTSYGTIQPIYEERLLQFGKWMKINEEAIYKSKPWTTQQDYATNAWYTMQKTTSGTNVYAILLDWPDKNYLYLNAPVASSSTSITMLGYSGYFSYSKVQPSGINITLPVISFSKIPSTDAWVFKLTDLKN
ncbi:alpha-L-fucosidase [Mytilus galloprovincialis]|uniref:alpha-L-fucosidase n=2 Tax=Mytilus galloprovincialis TaxID=29158 RepID=A0A8B6EIE9_MYTGA|nr:alpha-L-fucosidase [Mytilus galloprovincialis]